MRVAYHNVIYKFVIEFTISLSHTGSSDEDEDDIFSDDLVERGSDSDSGDNEQVS